jgi:hypothetical protein
MVIVMRITVIAVVVALAGCTGADGAMMSDGPDAGAMAPLSQTGGTGGTTPTTGGTGGTGGATAAGGTGGTDGTQPAPDAGAMKVDTMPSPDTQAPTTPQACTASDLHAFVCIDPPNSPNGKVLRKDGRTCNLCATYKSDGRTIEKQFVGCVPQAGGICVMACSECK